MERTWMKYLGKYLSEGICFAQDSLHQPPRSHYSGIAACFLVDILDSLQ